MFPEIYLSPSLSLPTYLVVISLTYCFALLWLVQRTTQFEKKFGLNRTIALDLALVIMLSGFLGARLFHVIYEMPHYYKKNPLMILKFWHGGFVFYGGALLAFFASIIFLKFKKQPIGPWADLIAPIGAFGYSLGRVACLLNGCCYGKVCDLPWSIRGRHPTPLYATLLELMILCILLFIESKKNKSYRLHQISKEQPGEIFLLWIGLHGLARFFMETLRDDDRGPLLAFHLTVSAWISLCLMLISLFGLIKIKKLKIKND